MTSAAVTINDLSLFPKFRETFYNNQDAIIKTKQSEVSAFNYDISYTDASINVDELYSKEIYKDQLLSQIEAIEILGDEWSEDDVKGPNSYVINYSEELVRQLVDNDLLPLRITQSIEEGISFVFKNKMMFFYLEIYNDKEFGILIEDYTNKSIVNNKEVFNHQEILEELTVFFNKT